VLAAAALGNSLITTKPTTQLQMVQGGTVTDEAVTEIAKLSTPVDVRTCELQREGTKDGVVLAWFCDGARVSAKTQAELSKMAGDKGTSIRMVPRLDGDRVVYDSTVTRGTKPDTLPVPVVGEAKAVENGEIVK
jgi:hypothetical protein